MPLNKPFNIGQAVIAIYVYSRTSGDVYKPLDNGFVVDYTYDEKRGYVLMIRDGLNYYEKRFDKVVFQ